MKMQLLKDPYGDRQVKTLDPPPCVPLDNKILYPKSGKSYNDCVGGDADVPDWELVREFLLKEGIFSKE